MRSITLPLIATLVLAVGSSTLAGNLPNGAAATTVPKTSSTTTAPSPSFRGPRLPGGRVTGPLSSKPVAFSTRDCRGFGGKVITVLDDRCRQGSRSSKYCKLPNGEALCIDDYTYQ